MAVTPLVRGADGFAAMSSGGHAYRNSMRPSCSCAEATINEDSSAHCHGFAASVSEVVLQGIRGGIERIITSSKCHRRVLVSTAFQRTTHIKRSDCGLNTHFLLSCRAMRDQPVCLEQHSVKSARRSHITACGIFIFYGQIIVQRVNRSGTSCEFVYTDPSL